MNEKTKNTSRQLRPYQERALKGIADYIKNYGPVIARVPVGFGKHLAIMGRYERAAGRAIRPGRSNP